MGTSKIAVDLSLRTFEIEVPDENVGQVLEMLGQLFDRSPPISNTEAFQERSSSEERVESNQESPDSGEPAKSKRKRGGGKAGTRVRAPELVDLGLPQDQRQAIQKFFTEKSPKGQNDQVATLGLKLKEFTNRSEFTADEIHSAFKIVNKPTPKNLMAVFGNMKRDGKAGYSDNKLIVNSFTEDHVNFHMNSAEK